jgi:hypothetical protein
MGFSNNVVDGSASWGRVNSYFTLCACVVLGACVMSAGLVQFAMANTKDPRVHTARPKSKTPNMVISVCACICGLSLSGCGLIWFNMVQKHKGLAAVSGAASIASMISS